MKKSKNIFKNITDIEKDYRIANTIADEQDIEKYSRKDYYNETLEQVDITKNDKKLLNEWLKRRNKNEKSI